MTVLERESRVQGSGLAVRERTRAPRSIRNPEPSTPNPRRWRFVAYFTRRGWIHALLLLGVWLFLFPFVWMVATSVKTDEELMEGDGLPRVESFRPVSPYVREVVALVGPADVTAERWEQLRSRLSDLAAGAVARYQHQHAPEASLAAFDGDQQDRKSVV